MVYKNERREMDSKRFKLDTTINLTHIFTTIGLIVTVASGWADVKTILAKHEERLNGVEVRNNRNDTMLQSQFSDIKNDIRSLNNKIDYVLDYRPLPNWKGRK